ncbi:alpha-ketoglutarate-dependent dioxygenase alkB homolog 4 isoform X2 [Mustela lutreola]|uniref:alpha-ketoglutarate-dependent dioxygenase alkB homolog 4 isoform X2 n=1 Tax=Mustela lutreola TaxID=9666 RepID=UPI00279767C0|nr:alpha-ketoglutarate-dependent dioxygenase alkB homolog 4 isoform X2 [Mustela lutreola]
MAAAAVASPEVLRECGCKGIRTCLICERQHGGDPPWQHPPQKTHRFIYYSDTGWAVGAEESDFEGWAFPFPGVTVIEDFVTREEEAEMVQLMDREPWKLSQSGRRKQNVQPSPVPARHPQRTSVPRSRRSLFPVPCQPLIFLSGFACAGHLNVSRIIEHMALRVSFSPPDSAAWRLWPDGPLVRTCPHAFIHLSHHGHRPVPALWLLCPSVTVNTHRQVSAWPCFQPWVCSWERNFSVSVLNPRDPQL